MSSDPYGIAGDKLANQKITEQDFLVDPKEFDRVEAGEESGGPPRASDAQRSMSNFKTITAAIARYKAMDHRKRQRTFKTLSKTNRPARRKPPNGSKTRLLIDEQIRREPSPEVQKIQKDTEAGREERALLREMVQTQKELLANQKQAHNTPQKFIPASDPTPAPPDLLLRWEVEHEPLRTDRPHFRTQRFADGGAGQLSGDGKRPAQSKPEAA